jgi:hypothetical protein
MKTVSIGFYREDGDFAILATLNNNDAHLADSVYKEIVQDLTATLAHSSMRRLSVLERQDTPDYINTQGE